MKLPKLKVVTLGGGSGTPAVLKALIQLGINDLTAISAAMDSGGKTGAIRSDERDRVIAISDLFRNLIALIPREVGQLRRVQTFIDTISYIDGRSRNLGYTLYYALLEKYDNDFNLVADHFERLLGVKFAGQAIPVTLEPSNIAFKTNSGRTFVGEHELDLQAMSRDVVAKVWLTPPVQATRQALKAVRQADVLIFCPGSLYGSVLANVLPLGMAKALKQSKATKILLTNLVSDRNQTHRFNVQKYFSIFKKYIGGEKPFDVVIMPDLSAIRFNKLYPTITKRYRLEHSYFLGRQTKDQPAMAKKGVRIVSADIFSITPRLSRIRHDSAKLKAVLGSVLESL